MLLFNLNILEIFPIENQRYQIKVQKLFLQTIEEDLITTHNKHILLDTNNIRGQYCNLHSKSLQNGPDVKKCIELYVYIYPWLQGYYISRTLVINTVNATINIE